MPCRPAAHPDSSGWQDLFARDLSDAIFPKGVWYFEGDVLTATEDQNIWTKAKYGNAIIDLEFKNAPGANSGVFVYGSDMKEWSRQFRGSSDPRRFASEMGQRSGHLALCRHFWPPGALEERRQGGRRVEPDDRHLPGDEDLRDAQWRAWSRKMDMTLWTSATKNPDGGDIPPWLSKPLAEMATTGHVGLQGKHGGCPIYFRNMKIKSLP